MMKAPERTISSKSKIRLMQMPHQAKGKVKEIEDAQRAVEKEKERVKIGVIQLDDHGRGQSALILLQVKAAKRPLTLEQNAMLIAVASAQIATRIAAAAMHHLTMKIARSVMHMRRNAIKKARCHMPCRHQANVAQS